MSANSQIDIRGNPIRRIQDMRLTRASGLSASIPKPWDLTFAVENEITTAKLKNCCFSRDPIFFWIGTKTATVTAGSTETWMSAKINTFDGSCEILTGDYEDVIDLAVPDEPTYIKKMLYKLEADGDTWKVILDLRNIGLTLRV